METDFAIYKPALERQLQSWFWLNNFMRPWIISLDRLVEVNGSAIVIDLTAFDERYTNRYYNGQVGDICKKLIDNILQPKLGMFLKEVGFRAHAFEVIVRRRGKIYKQMVSAKNPDWT